MTPAIRREMPFMGAPAELRRLRALADKAVDRPGVDELARLLRRHRHLGIALGDVDGLDAEALGETRPLAAAAGNAGAESRVAGEVEAGEVEERLLDEMRDETRIGAVRQDRGRALRKAAAQGERALAQRIVRPRRRRQLRVGVPARPRLDAGIEIERTLLLAELDQRHARHVDRDVEQKIAGAEPSVEHIAVVVAGQRGI